CIDDAVLDQMIDTFYLESDVSYYFDVKELRVVVLAGKDDAPEGWSSIEPNDLETKEGDGMRYLFFSNLRRGLYDMEAGYYRRFGPYSDIEGLIPLITDPQSHRDFRTWLFQNNYETDFKRLSRIYAKNVSLEWCWDNDVRYIPSDGDLSSRDAFSGQSGEDRIIDEFEDRFRDVLDSMPYLAPCPECGTVCETECDYGSPVSVVGSLTSHPRRFMRPSCGFESVLHMKNDGYRTGFTFDKHLHPVRFESEVAVLARSLPEKITSIDDAERALDICIRAEEYLLERNRTVMGDVIGYLEGTGLGDRRELDCYIVALWFRWNLGGADDTLEKMEPYADRLEGVAAMCYHDVACEGSETEEDCVRHGKAVADLFSQADGAPIDLRFKLLRDVFVPLSTYGEEKVLKPAIGGMFDDLVNDVDRDTDGTVIRYLSQMLHFLDFINYREGDLKAIEDTNSTVLEMVDEDLDVRSLRQMASYLTAIAHLTMTDDREKALGELQRFVDDVFQKREFSWLCIGRVILAKAVIGFFRGGVSDEDLEMIVKNSAILVLQFFRSYQHSVKDLVDVVISCLDEEQFKVLLDRLSDHGVTTTKLREHHPLVVEDLWRINLVHFV
ncbi:MAG: hypothetical protein IJ856_05370, partial [Candidatus Methanomethylophilaceae archaeon]|nr:hypothetical protein [Candidatus Methanomethylophilaceae archaeon]